MRRGGSITRALVTVGLALHLVGGLVACGVQVRSTRSPELVHRAVRDAEDRRDVDSSELPFALGSQYPGMRVLGLRVLARSEEVGTSSLAVPLLGDVDGNVAGWAAFALGQIGDEHAEAALLESLRSVSRAPEQALLALARSGTASTAQGLVAWLEDKRSSVRAAAALGLGLVAKRDPSVLNAERVHDALGPELAAPDLELRYAASYALSRLPGPKVPALLVTVLRDVDPEVRMNAARGIGAATGGPFLLDAALSDPDWRVRVEVARALGAIGKGSEQDVDAVVQRLRRVATNELGALAAANRVAAGQALHVLRTALASLLALGAPARPVLEELEARRVALAGTSPETAADRARFHCELAFARDALARSFRHVAVCGDASIRAWRRWQLEARLLGRFAGEDPSRLLQLELNADSRARLAMIEALGELDNPASTAALVRLLEAKELLMVSAAAGFLAGRIAQGYAAPELPARLSAALARTREDPDAGLAAAVLDAIAALGPQAAALRAELRAAAQDPRIAVRRRAVGILRILGERERRIGPTPAAWPDPRPAPFGARLQAELVTARGSFQVELWGDLAPRAVGTFLALAREGRYEGRVFHRVVPGFVAQGGGERGDGWGSPGYTIEDECSPVPFARGVLGIATGGRDVGGSQFFVMHARHPHLEGAYTAFGRVTGGLEVAEALQVDDEILEVRLSTLEDAAARPGLPSTPGPG